MSFEVRIAAINWPPKMVILDVHDSNADKLDGIWGRITDIIFAKLNISYTIVIPNDGKTWGHLNQSTGYYDGLIGLLQTNRADIIPVTTENLKRREVIDYTTPLEVTQTSILTSVMVSSNVANDVVQHFFDIEYRIWLLLFICSLMTNSLIFNNFKSNHVSKVSNYFWNLWKIMTSQKIDHKLVISHYLRITLSLTNICICFIIYNFLATISSDVILRNTSVTIDSLEDLISNENMRPAFFAGTAHEAWFINNKNHLTNKILSNSKHFKGDQMFTDDVFTPLIENKIAIIAGTENLESISIKACNKYLFSKFYIASKTFNDNRNGYAIRKGINSQFRRTFQKKVKEISTSGIFDYISKQEIRRFAGESKYLQCLVNGNTDHLSEDHDKAIEMKSFTNLFKLYCYLLVITFLTLMLETLMLCKKYLNIQFYSKSFHYI